MNIIALQTDIVWENKPANFDKVRRLLASASPAPGDLAVLPEMFATGFNMNIPAVAESHNQATELFLAQTARDYQIFLVAGLVAAGTDNKALNQAVVFTPQGDLLLRYTKIHPFSYADEDKYFAPGHELTLFNWAGFTVCPVVCYDLRFPELFRLAVCRGADLFVVVANWPKRRKLHWETLLRARAIENIACVVGVNRVGSDPNVSYSGQSQIIDPHGKILALADDQETALVAAPDLDDLKKLRERFPALRDLKPQFLGNI